MSVCVFSILFSNISYHTDMENLFLNLNPGLLFLAINSFILVTVWYRKATLDAANSKGLRVKLPWKHPTGWSARGILIELMQKQKKDNSFWANIRKTSKVRHYVFPYLAKFVYSGRVGFPRVNIWNQRGFLSWENESVFCSPQFLRGEKILLLDSFWMNRKNCGRVVHRTVSETAISVLWEKENK